MMEIKTLEKDGINIPNHILYRTDISAEAKILFSLCHGWFNPNSDYWKDQIRIEKYMDKETAEMGQYTLKQIKEFGKELIKAKLMVKIENRYYWDKEHKEMITPPSW